MTSEIGLMQVRAHAKINLSLRVLKKRSDGFHEIETLIAPISLFDTIDIQKQSRWIDFSCDDASLPGGEENLVVRAAKVFVSATKTKSGIAITLKKQIPHGAGLGGGSSDAASTLIALNELFETRLSRAKLAKMAESIGSDVPFFIFGYAAICKGRGERVEPTKLPGPFSILLLKPEFGVPTEWAYKLWGDSREIPGVNYAPQNFAEHIFVNDLERPVFEKFVSLAQTKMWLLNQPEVGVALMSGSGSTIFAVMRPNSDATLVAQRAIEKLDPHFWTCVAQTL